VSEKASRARYLVCSAPSHFPARTDRAPSGDESLFDEASTAEADCLPLPSATFAAAYKRAILSEVVRADPGSVRAILQREGLYFADVLRWREQEARGQLDGVPSCYDPDDR
jgi:hypothetical protein